MNRPLRLVLPGPALRTRLPKKDPKEYNEEALKAYLARGQAEVDAWLGRYLPEAKAGLLYEAIRYSLFAGGKRLRPNLCLAAAESTGRSGARKAALPIACAIELIHTYSLVHDDLPAMDNDDLRRGKPTNHKVYGEGTAILVGDALLTEAFMMIAQSARQPGMLPPPSKKILDVLIELGSASGMHGMVLGQFLDLESEGKGSMTTADLETIHRNKTGALITASVRTGGIMAQASEEQLKRLTEYGKKVGLAFQIMDDVLDVSGTEKELGKSVRQDRKKEKWTYPRLLGLRKARSEANRLTEEALTALAPFGLEANPLRWIACHGLTRKN